MNKKIILLSLLAVLFLVAGCTQAGTGKTSGSAAVKTTQSTTSAPAQSITLTGAGSTFIYPLMSKWSYVYNNLKNVKINYASIGSGGGIRQIVVKTVDFGATDAPLQSYGYSHIHGALTIPESIGGVTLSYNIPGVTKKLRLDGDVIADIYLGKITKWDNKAITALNPGVNLPDKSIMVVHRSDGSGTTFTFSDYLSSVSPTWKAKVGKGKSLSWPVGLGGKGNEGVAGLIKENPYSIGYVELAYVIENKMAYATLKNRDGYYVNPTIDTVKAAAAGAILPNGDGIWSNVSIVNSPGKNAYPISTFTYIVEYPDLSVLPDMTEPKAKALVGFMWWMVHDGQKYAPGLLYVPLPNKVVKIDEETIKSIKYKGQPVLR